MRSRKAPISKLNPGRFACFLLASAIGPALLLSYPTPSSASDWKEYALICREGGIYCQQDPYT